MTMARSSGGEEERIPEERTPENGSPRQTSDDEQSYYSTDPRDQTTTEASYTDRQMTLDDLGRVVHRMRNVSIIKAVTLFAMFVLMSVGAILVSQQGNNIEQNTVNIEQLDHSIEKLDGTVNVTLSEAKHTRVALENALKEAGNGNSEFTNQVLDALARIKHIETILEQQQKGGG
jgi:septal ring factor EnvC (AmiA/AmiB activator)